MEKKYILILIVLLVVIWVISDIRHLKEDSFEKAWEYSFQGKTPNEINEQVIRESLRYSSAKSDEVQILSLVNMLECRYYLLYNNQFSLKKYYDLIRVILHPELRYQVKNKKKYIDEIGKFLRRKRKLRIEYLKYEVSRPVFSREGSQDSAEVFLIRTTRGDKEYLKYDLRKHTNNKYHLYLGNTISFKQSKFKFNHNTKKEKNE
jgi:hypothetical protein